MFGLFHCTQPLTALCGTVCHRYVAILNDPTANNLVLPLPKGQIYVDFSMLIGHYDAYIRRCSITIVLCLFSVLKYLRHSTTYGSLVITLAYAGPEIARFMLMFLLVNLTFTMMGMLMFGAILPEFSTMGSAIQTLMMMMTGEYGYEAVQAVNEVSASTFYVLYLILVFFILVNMFLAIVFDAYAVLQERKAEVQPYPYRYSYWEEEVAQLWRASRRGPDLFVLTTEEMHALLTDHKALGSSDIGVQRVVQESEEESPKHHVKAAHTYETVITREDMLGLGWPELHVRWLLSQIGVPDNQSETDGSGDADTVTTSAELLGPNQAAQQPTKVEERIINVLHEVKADIMRQHRRDVNALRQEMLVAIAEIHENSQRNSGSTSHLSSGSASASLQSAATPVPRTSTGRRRRLS